MRTVFAAIEDRKIAVVESPTGTGKSLTLLTATLSWLAAHRRRLDEAAEADMRARFAAEDPDDPPWIIENAVKRHMGELRHAEAERAARLAAVRERERRRTEQGAFRKRPRPSTAGPKEEVKEADFLPEDSEPDDGLNLSAEVRALMAQLDKPRTQEEVEEDVPKVYFTSRTHSQLRQLTAELLKTSFAEDDTDDRVSAVPLASRRQMCINDKVRALGREDKINEACLDMQKSGAQRCPHLPRKGDEGPLLDASDSVLATVRDIEDLVTEGRRAGVCPYYATRRATKAAQLVTLPYNLILQKNAREALGINLTDQIVVIDEAHNLIDTILGIYSVSLPTSHISSAAAQLTQYLHRFRSRLKPRHSLMIQQTLTVLRGLVGVCAAFENGKESSEMMDVNTLMACFGRSADAVNLLEIVGYLKESKLARKVSGFAESLEEKEGKRSAAARHASIAAFRGVEALLLSLTDARDDGRVILSKEDGTVLKYVLLNPAERFAEVVSAARSVVLAGGTMEPLADFFTQLFPSIPRDRFATLSCAHVIPKTHLLTQVITRGPRKLDLEFTFAKRRDPALLGELGAVVQSTVGLVPDGVVVFVPSYAFLDALKATWTTLLPKLEQRKQIFYEPQTAGEVETVLRGYAQAIEAPKLNDAGRARTGALLFAVVGGKLSEGINFSDRLGRCVIMVGLPFANVRSVELQERMRYVERLPGAGKDAARELYENLCMRTVNQSIGRAIRHANDYATILLVDNRYARPRVRGKLPKWIGEGVRVCNDWGEAAKGIAGFFRDKRVVEGVGAGVKRPAEEQ
ncbi:hypothetical protein CspeluHIS016_0106470 [Cutaneotrichosporon spelunceum]|uniref:ATP-dependent DNA helicase CHL1 n=1 Tax=Cutaneotrichosporon spelunceum TaxID=1672016 RepID=A0AAD3TPE9_9TREE|nr:hypothetical protein CspeluHIS016_0106470 [Cutaneotrichosporon spelunceum]